MPYLRTLTGICGAECGEIRYGEVKSQEPVEPLALRVQGLTSMRLQEEYSPSATAM